MITCAIDVETYLRGRFLLRVEGEEHRTGDPWEPGVLDYSAVYLLHRLKNGGHARRLLPKAWYERLDLDEAVYDALQDQAADRAVEAGDAKNKIRKEEP